MQAPKSSPALSIAILSLVLALFNVLIVWSVVNRPASKSGGSAQETTLQRIKRDNTLRVGYGGFPPYTILDAQETDSSKRVKGFAADIVNEIAARSVPPMKVEWHLINWETLRSDIMSKKFDFIADPVYQTVPRAIEFAYCDPYSYFGIALGVVRKNEQRFKTFKDLDRDDIVIAIAEGWVSTDYARAHLTKPKLKTIPVGGDAYVQLDDVLMGRADIALQDSPTVVQYAKAHPDKVKVLWLDHPPCIVPGGFAVRTDDGDLLRFLNSCLAIMRADGTISNLNKKWNSYGYFEDVKLIPGEGLRQYLESEHKTHEL
jgi:cyclohexadienyl dehydratase